MKFIPILFSTPMVQAILEKRKDRTRRTKGLEKINISPTFFRYDRIDSDMVNKHWFEILSANGRPKEKYVDITCPYGQVGDVLWVRESYIPNYFDDYSHGYKANWNSVAAELVPKPKWKPSIHMPKAACRIFLKITEIKVERLNKISEEDAKKEGVEIRYVLEKVGDEKPIEMYKDYSFNEDGYLVYYASFSFQTLWQSINGKDSWEANPWVWVISFERIEKPTDFNS